jgi:hypothetical protein
MIDSVEITRLTSKALLGSRHRLEVAYVVAVSREPVIYARALAIALAQVGIATADNKVSGELRHFAAAGVMRELPRSSQSQPVYFERLPHPFWDFARAAVEIPAVSAPGQDTQISDPLRSAEAAQP